MAFGFFKRLSGDPSESELRKIRPQIKRINELAEPTKALSDAQLKAKTEEFKQRHTDGTSLDDLLPEAFAVVREAAERVIGERHFDVQLMGGAVLHKGIIAEMKTGEGKTLTSTLPVYLNAIGGQGVHVVTVNEYLATRDTEWMGQVYQFLGVTVGNIYHDQPTGEKRAAYAADITYGTNNEFGFDYLRDNMVQSLEEVVQRPLSYAIVDEVDSILIDESRTPLIISAPAEAVSEQYKRFAQLMPKLKLDTHFTVDEKRRSAVLTDAGIKQMEQYLGIDNIYEAGGLQLVHHMEQALQAFALFKLDKEYVVKEGEVVIVDEFTGRMMPGRRFSEGLHQAIEAKEGVKIQQESRTMATITFQNYFRIYEKLAGMTGTALTEKEEFHQIYSLSVVAVPTHREMVRTDLNDQIYKNEPVKFEAVAKDVKARHEQGQPVLLGTIAVEKSERLSQSLTKAGVPHEILNAKNHAREADIISAAGQKGAVTVSTNMAGRGTDIKLGHGVAELGGLHVIGSERHEARRIDNQLRGRSGRQGDPGSSQFYVSLEDDLMRIFAGDRIKGVMERLKVPDDQPIEAGIISKSLESAQKKVEGHNYDIRKHVVEYDDVMNAHREVVYARRRKSLEAQNIKEDVLGMFDGEVDLLVAIHAGGDDVTAWEFDKIAEGVATVIPTEGDLAGQISGIKSRDELLEGLHDMVRRAYEAKEAEETPENMRTLERMVVLNAIDTLWVDHLDAMEHLREGVGLRGYGQRDPLVEYKQEAYRLFEELLANVQLEVTRTIFKVSLATPQAPSEMAQAAANVKTGKRGDTGAKRKAVIGEVEPGEEPIEQPVSAPPKEPAPPAEAEPSSGDKPKAAAKSEPAAPESAKAAPAPQPAAPQAVSAAAAEALASTPSASEAATAQRQAEAAEAAAAEASAPVEETIQEGSSTVTVKQRRSAPPNPAASSTEDKVGRNDPCPCGSGLKYKRCGLVNAPEHRG